MREREQDDQEQSEVPSQAASPVTAATPALGRGVTAPAKVTVDAMPFDAAALAQLTPEQRCAIYLNQIRKMLIFFVVLAAVGLVAGIIIGIVDINAVHQANQGISPGF